MYDFYPEWGPARNRDEAEAQPMRRPRYWTPASAPEARDAHLQRPDDN